MAQDPEKISTFQVAMAGFDMAIPVVGHFDFSVLKNSEGEDRVQLVDVGGGHGTVLKQILDAHPDLDPAKCVLEDRANVIEMAKSNSVLPPSVPLVIHDFLATQPIRGAKAYFMRMIMHDYADPVCIEILSRLAEVMESDSRILICDMVIPERVGEADFPAAVLDQAVISMGGKERTEKGFEKLFHGAGLELVKTWKIIGVPGACVEGRLKR
jgi:hypothetical protein